jgi:hypothetical protein
MKNYKKVRFLNKLRLIFIMNPFKNEGKKKNGVSFNLENKHFRNLHLLLYLASLTIVLVFYTLTLLVFDKSQFAYVLMVIFSVCVGIFLVFRKDAIVKQMSNELDKRKRNDIRRTDNKNLKKTLHEVGVSKSKREIGSRNKNLKLNISGKISFSKRVTDIKKRFVKKDPNQNEPQYIEIE